MQIIPFAAGQSEGTVVFWEDNAEIGVAWPRAVQVIDEIRWGVGSVDRKECLVLYLFSGDQVAELYLPEVLPTTPSKSIEIWRVLCEWRPEVLKLRYGGTPTERDREVMFLLPKMEGESLVEKLSAFRDVVAAREESTGGEAAPMAADAEIDRAGTNSFAADGPAMGMAQGLLTRLDVCLAETSRFRA